MKSNGPTEKTRTLVLKEPLEVLRNVRGTNPTPGNPCFLSRGRDLVWAFRTPEGGTTLHLQHTDQTVEARAWGQGASWALEQVPDLIGQTDQDSSLFQPEGLLRRAHRRHPGLRIAANRRVFETLVPVILGQKVLGKEAASSYRRIVRRYGDPAPGPVRLNLPPTAETFLRLGYEDLHALGVERKRGEVILRCSRIADQLDALKDSADQLRARLLKIPGIGPWTSSIVVRTAAGDPDSIPLGDYNLPNFVTWNLTGEPRGDEETMLRLLEPYKGHRARALQLITADGKKPPRYGPRLEFRRVERF